MSELQSTPAQAGGKNESAELVQKLEPLLRPEKKPQAVEVVATYMRKVHSGPLPAPEDFQHYEQVLPGSADRIIRLTEKEQAHRHQKEDRHLWLEYLSRLTGQVGAMVALLAMLGTVAYCASIGQPVAAAVLGAVGTIVIGFLKYSAREVPKQTPAPSPPASKRKRK